jgi:hypothetical protein
MINHTRCMLSNCLRRLVDWFPPSSFNPNARGTRGLLIKIIKIMLQISWQMNNDPRPRSSSKPNPPTQSEAPKIAFSWFITPITMVHGAYNELVTGAFVNQLITGGPHIAGGTKASGNHFAWNFWASSQPQKRSHSS